MGGISLTASMRSNLLSLQNISGQVDLTQNKLSTGKKVNSAIDNPSSYYTALSLNNRADDLNALLDSMGQAVSTIKAATTALESATEFLEQAKAVANQALETAKPIIARVSTEDELLTAIDSGKQGLIVLEQDITLSTDQTLELKEGQSLVGKGYVDGSGSKTKLIFDIQDTKDFGLKINSNSMLANLEIGDSAQTTNIAELLYINEAKNVILQDLKINWKSDVSPKASIFVDNGSEVMFLGTLDITTSTTKIAARALKAEHNSKITIDGTVKIVTNGDSCHGLDIERGSCLSIINNSQVHIDTRAKNSKALMIWDNSFINVCDDAVINIKTSGKTANGLYLSANQGVKPSQFIQSGNSKINIWIEGDANGVEQVGTGNILEVKDNAQLNILVEGTGVVGTQILINPTDNAQVNIVAPDGTSGPNTADLKNKISNDWNAEIPVANTGKSQISASEYNNILNQYDALIKDASYKGINLLQTDKLSVKFNEDNSSSLNVQGKDMSTKALGFTVLEWQTQEDVNKSIEELSLAINSIRNYSSELGNNYNIITTRQDFTESLINVLTEGADKLTLADMNEESANMLALQTRQQLAINSLSLASQASQSILKLF